MEKLLDRDHGGAAGAIVGDDALIEALAQLLADEPAEHVDQAAGRRMDDETDRPRRIILRLRRDRAEHKPTESGGENSSATHHTIAPGGQGGGQDAKRRRRRQSSSNGSPT